MSDMSKYENHPSTLLRAAYILTGLSWEQSENFEFLQKLATQCEEAFQQSVQADETCADCKLQYTSSCPSLLGVRCSYFQSRR